jgi:hypothetical protein
MPKKNTLNVHLLSFFTFVLNAKVIIFIPFNTMKNLRLRVFSIQALFFSFSMVNLCAQHSIGLNAGAGPSFQYGGTPFFSTAFDYQFRFKAGLTLGGNVGFFSNDEMRKVPNGNRLLSQLAASLAAQVGYDFPIGIMRPFLRLDLGGAFANREGFFIQPMVGNEIEILDRLRLSLAFQVPIFVTGPVESGLVMSGGLRYVFVPKKK